MSPNLKAVKRFCELKEVKRKVRISRTQIWFEIKLVAADVVSVCSTSKAQVIQLVLMAILMCPWGPSRNDVIFY